MAGKRTKQYHRLDYEYIYYNEQEILFPPFLPLKIEELALTKGEKKMIKDMHNNPPVGKYLIQPGSFPDYREIIKSSKEELYQRILSWTCSRQALRIQRKR